MYITYTGEAKLMYITYTEEAELMYITLSTKKFIYRMYERKTYVT
jgi:hypothetical protein